EGGAALLQAGIEGTQVRYRLAVDAGRGARRPAPADVPGRLAPGQRGARLLQVLVDLRGAANAAQRVDEFRRRAPQDLVDAELEGCLVVEEGGMAPVEAEQPGLRQQRGGNPRIPVDVEIHQIG